MKALVNPGRIRALWVGKEGQGWGEHLVILYGDWIIGKIDPYTGKIWGMLEKIPQAFLDRNGKAPKH